MINIIKCEKILFRELKYKNFNNFALQKLIPVSLDKSPGYTRRKRKRSVIGQFIYNIRKSFGNIRISKRNEFKEYRPYLGSKHQGEHTSAQADEIVSTDPAINKVYPKLKKSTSSLGRLEEFKRKWELRKEERRKKKYKRKIKKSHLKEHRRRARIDFIRKFLPNYKRENIPFEELSAEQAAETIKQHQKNYFYYTLNSTLLFIIAYLVVYMLYQFTVLIVASNWKLDSVLLYYDLAFNDYSPLWSRSNIIIITLSGPLVCLISGFLFYRFFSTRQNVKGFVKLFFLWIALIGFNLFFGAWATGISFDQGFGYVPAWLYLNVFWQIFVALIFLFILGMIGYYSVPKFLDTSKSAYRVRPENKTKFLFFQVILPWFIGSLVIIIVRIPNNMLYDSGNMVTLAFTVAPMIFNKFARPTITFDKEKKATNIRWLFVVIFVALMLVYRIGLNNGLHITMNYDFSISLDITPL
jgi:hypothetical protein